MRTRFSPDVTGVRRSAEGDVQLVELESRAAVGRVAYAQAALPGVAAPIAALVVDGAPLVVVVPGARGGALALQGRAPPHPLPTGREDDAVALDEARAVRALGHLLPLLQAGLYSVTKERLAPAVAPGPSFAPADPGARLVFDVEGLAPDGGEPIVADLGPSFGVLLGGRAALLSGQAAYVVSAGFVVEAAGFEAHAHDRGAREAFARSPRALLEDGALRDAWAAHKKRFPVADVGPFTEDRVEPAIQLARAVVWDLRAEDGVQSVSDVTRERAGRTTELRVEVVLGGRAWEVAFVSTDGRHLHEAVVRRGPRFLATGLKPSGRAVARCLRALCEEAS